MSLVHDALQKAEREKQRKSGVGDISPATVTAPLVTPQPLGSTPVAMPSTRLAPAAPVAPSAEAQRPHYGVLSALIVCVAIVAMVAMVFLVGNAPWLRDSRKPAATDSDAAVAKPAISPVPTAASSESAATPPAVRSESSPSADARFRITGITIDPDGKPWAIINGQLRSEAQYVDGAIVKKIERDRVTLEVDARNVVVRLF
jgi:hypothetical protein